MATKAILITGASGEIGHALIQSLSQTKDNTIVALDIKDLDYQLDNLISIKADIRDRKQLEQIFAEYDFEKIFHLAAILSTGGEKNPQFTHEVNVDGSANLLDLAQQQTEKRGSATIFIFPSTIAVYGISSLEKKIKAGTITEKEFLDPITIYGVNKIYVEKLGTYYSEHYKFLNNDAVIRLDFRSIRFPGIMSGHTVPSGGTSDYGPEMIHAAAKGETSDCFVNPDSTIPFMVMPDAVKAILDLAAADGNKLTQRVYNVKAFSVSAKDIEQELKKYYPKFQTNYKIHPKRLQIVESWPMDINDEPARKDWNWKPEFDFKEAFENYLIPQISKRYNKSDCESLPSCGNG